MKERVIKLLEEDENLPKNRNKPFVSTFHALGVQIIKENNLPKEVIILHQIAHLETIHAESEAVCTT